MTNLLTAGIGCRGLRAESKIESFAAGLGLAPSEGIYYLIFGLFLVPLLFLAIYAVPRIIRYFEAKKQKGLIEEMRTEAARFETAGKFVSAASIYEKLKDFERAALLYEKGGDFKRSAEVFESLGDMDRVKELYDKAGDWEKSAEASMAVGDYVEAARSYDRHGDKLKAARALELTGNRLAAVRAYREAKAYAKASELLSEEGMHKEAAEMYKIFLADKVFGAATIDYYYSFASLLERAGDIEKAREVLREILKAVPDYRDAADRLRVLGAGPSAPLDTPEAAPSFETPKEAEPGPSREEPAGHATTLRNIMRSGRMEPRYSFRLWVQVLKELDRKSKHGRIPEHISPDSIFIDNSNRIDFDENASKDFSYISPEVVQGERTDQTSAIYSLGIILYEMITGSLDTAGVKKPREVSSDVPEWLEELTLKCIEKNRADRYGSLEEIFSTLIALKHRM